MSPGIPSSVVAVDLSIVDSSAVDRLDGETPPAAGGPVPAGAVTPAAEPPDSEQDPAPSFSLLIAGLETGDIHVLLSFQQVRWHFTAEQAAAFGVALTEAAARARDLAAQYPARNGVGG